ncbi:hypothetical protein HRbin08_01320 [bacterium HR08]|nr:hypothetical protein HRbin08_01320 [bacterium HR08]
MRRFSGIAAGTRGAALLLLLALAPIPRSTAGAQSSDEYVAARFTGRCSSCWPDWIELFRPLRGIGPQTQNGLAFLFVNGSLNDPWRNQSHLYFSKVEVPTEVLAQFQFNNATIGGRLVLTDGNFYCLPPSHVMAFVTDELFVLTLRDDGESWYGAFVGDLTLLDPEFAPQPERADMYTTVGLLEKAGTELRLRALRVIPQITRFSPLEVRLALEEPPTGPLLVATFQIKRVGIVEVRAPLEPEELRPTGRAGVVYLVGNGAPCASLVQREIALRAFLAR